MRDRTLTELYEEVAALLDLATFAAQTGRDMCVLCLTLQADEVREQILLRVVRSSLMEQVEAVVPALHLM